MAFDVASGVLGMGLGASLTAAALFRLGRRRREAVRPILKLQAGSSPWPGVAVTRNPEPAPASAIVNPRLAPDVAEDLGCRLRTSLNAVLGFCDLLLTDRAAPPSPRQAQSLGEIRSAGLTLLNLVEAEIERGPSSGAAPGLVPEAAAVLPLLRRLCDARQGIALAAGVELAQPNGETDLKVVADRNHLRQALEILLDQTLSAATSGAVLRPLVRKERDFIEISVAVRHPPDLGFSITPPVRAALADHGRDLERAQNLAIAMGGRLEARGPGRGDPALSLLLPPAMGIGARTGAGTGAASRPTGRPRPAGQAAAAVPYRPIILYIEDDVSNARLMRRVLDRLGAFDLYIAETARTGLRMVDQAAPDAVILDIDLPDLDGWTVKSALADADATRNIPVLALSAAASAQDIRRGLEAGFLDYLTKPLDPALLAMALNRALGPGFAATDRPAAPKSRIA